MRLARSAAGLLGIGGATYGVMAYSGVYFAERELHAIEQKLNEEAAAKQDLESRINDQQTTASSLVESCKDLGQRLESANLQLEAARNEVQRLEADREESRQQQAQAQDELQRVREQVSMLQRDFLKRHEAYLEAETAAASKRERVAKARHDANPLNHPRVKELLGR